jgi:Flp pilus assembly protein TadB
VIGTLLLLSVCLVTGGLLLTAGWLGLRAPALPQRLARAQGTRTTVRGAGRGLMLPAPVRERLTHLLTGYQRDLRRAGREETARQLVMQKVLFAVAFPLIPSLPYAAAAGRLPSVAFIALLAVVGFVAPDLRLRAELRQRREAIFLDLPEAIAVMSLSLRAGQSLRQALELAARDCPGALGEELGRALSLARRDRGLGEREALVQTARETGEPAFERFAELLAAKESPYVEFLRQQAAAARAEQARQLERAHDRAYLAMHAPLVPLLAVLVLLVAYGFLHFLNQTI